MNVFTMVVIVVALAMTAEVLRTYFKSKSAKPQNPDEVIEKSSYAAEIKLIKKLEERIRVLERIATDKGHKLREEIDSL